MRRVSKVTCLILMAGVVVGWAISTMVPSAKAAGGPRLPTGKKIIIYLRADAGGAAADRGPDISRLAFRSGTLENYDDEWLQLSAYDGKTYWFARSSIAAVSNDEK